MKRPTTLAAAAALYLLPSALAVARSHRNLGAVVALNMFAGWTVVGWLIALVWAVYKDPSSY
jgi:hypothetical protein